MIKVGAYSLEAETYLKAKVLTHGIVFTESAIKAAINRHAKGQNLIYNAPITSEGFRPQELLVTNRKDGYKVVISCVSPSAHRPAVLLDAYGDGNLLINGEDWSDELHIDFVKEPFYYNKTLSNGDIVKQYVSACGLDELNIFPWKGCAISKCCLFCGTNSFVHKGDVSAFSVNRVFWTKFKHTYLQNLCEAIDIAKHDECYSKHMHVVLISGNLANDLLDLETDIFCEISEYIMSSIGSKAYEGIVAVITPPSDNSKIQTLYDSGIKKAVFNLEAIQPKYFEKYCPGKAEIGYKYLVDRLIGAVDIFGNGNVWSNLVYGLEPKVSTLKYCAAMAEKGVVMGANVLHIDRGSRLDCCAPNIEDVVDFFAQLESINNSFKYAPYYCSLALRTSLSNEAHDGRIKS